MELTIENLIKIIVGVLVVAAVSYGVYLFFTHQFLDFFRFSVREILTIKIFFGVF